MVIGYAIDFVRRYRSFVTRSLATLCHLSLACPLYSLLLRPDAAVFEGTWTMPDVELVKLREDGSV
jgi:hypothetical protein